MCLYNSYPPQKKQRPAVIDQAVFSVLYERNLHTLWLTLLPVFIETTAISRIFECRTTGYKSVDIWKVLRPAILFKFLSDFRRSWSKFWVSTHILFDTGFFSWIFPKISVQNAAYPVFPNFFPTMQPFEYNIQNLAVILTSFPLLCTPAIRFQRSLQLHFQRRTFPTVYLYQKNERALSGNVHNN